MSTVALTDINILTPWHYEGDSGTVRWFYNDDFLDDEDGYVMGGDGLTGFWYQSDFTVVNGFPVCDNINLVATANSRKPTVTLSARFFDENNTPRNFLFTGWTVPSNATLTFGQLEIYNEGATVSQPLAAWLTRDEIYALIGGLTIPDASDSVKGKTKLSIAPVSASNPIAVGDNDPRLTSPVYLSVLDFGAAGDAVAIEDAVISLLTPTTLASASGGLTSAIIGKVIAVAGAGVGGATLITTVTAVPTANTLTLASAASTAVTNTRAVYGTNNRVPFEDALDAAANSSTIRTVFIPEGDYLFSSGSLTIPEGVTLQGSWEYAPDHMGYRYANEVKPMSGKGTTLVIVAGEGSASGRFILLNTMSALRGVCMFYPSNLGTLSTPKLYPWAIEMFGTGPVVENVELLNPYQGIYSHIGQRHLVQNVRGTPLLTGLYASQQLETSRYLNITFVPIYTFSTTELSPFPMTQLMQWIHQNGTAFKIGRVDNGVFYNCFTFAYFKGFRFVVDASEATSYANGTGAPGGRAWVQMTDCGADVCPYPLDVDDVQGVDSTGTGGVSINSSTFVCAQWFAFGGPELVGVFLRSTFTGSLGLSNCKLRAGNKLIYSESTGGRLRVTGCYFQDWVINAIHWNTSGIGTIAGSNFRLGSATPVVKVGTGAWVCAAGNVFEYADHQTFDISTGANTNWSEGGNVFNDSPKNVAVTYQNSWVDFGGALQAVTYIKRDGRVYLRGGAKNGTVGTGVPVFTLPVGFRPAASLVFAVSSNNLFGIVQVAASGVVSVELGNNTSVFFDGISFAVR